MIVNLTDKDLNLSKGTLSKKILKKAGSPIQAELKKVGLGTIYSDIVIS